MVLPQGDGRAPDTCREDGELSKTSKRRRENTALVEANWDSIFRKDAGAKDGPTIDGAKASASSITEADRDGGQGKAQDGRQAEGID